MRALLLLGFASALALAGCARTALPSAPHSLLGEPIPWPALHRVCAAPTRFCQSGEETFRPAESRLIEFWSPSCAPCRQRLQQLHRHRDEFAKRGWSFELVAVVSSDESDALVLEKLSNWGVGTSTWVLAEPDATQLHVSGLPSLWLVSSRGHLQWVAPARASLADILRELDDVHP